MDANSISTGESICKHRSLIVSKNDGNNASFMPLRKVKTEPIDAAEYNFKKRCIVYTTKLDDMNIFNQDMENVTMKTLLDNILIESLPRIRNVRPYVYPLFELQKRNYKDMVNTLEIIKQKSLFLSHLVNKSELNNDDVAKDNPDVVKLLSDTWIKSELDIDDGNLDLLKFPNEICIKSELDTDEEAKDHSDAFQSLFDIQMKSNLMINDEAKDDSDVSKFPFDEVDADDASKDNFDVLTSASQLTEFNDFINVKSEYTHCGKIESESNLLSEIVDATALPKDNTKYISSDAKQCQKIKELLKLCKPLSVILIDFNKSLMRVSEDKSSDDDDLPLRKLKTKHSTRQSHNNKSHHRPKLPARNKPQYLGAFKQFIQLSNVMDKPKRFSNLFKKVNEKTTTHRIIMIINLYSKDVDIYCINKKGWLVDYHKTNKNNIDEVLTEFPEITYPHRKEICCWYKREEYIRTIVAKFLDVATQRFMRKPHICLPGKCTCCCKKDNLNRVENSSPIVNHPSSLEDSNAIDLENEISNTTIQVKMKTKKLSLKSNSTSFKGSKQSKVLSTLIDKAMTFKKQSSQTNTPSLEVIENDCLRNKLIINNNVPKSQREFYELGPKGQVIFYLKWLTSSHNKLMAQNLTDPRYSRIKKPVCCWVQREIAISKLVDLGLSRNVANFMRSPHTCPESKCWCCCYTITLNNTLKLQSLVGINLPKRAGHSKENVYLNIKKHANTIENVPVFYKTRQEATLTKYCLNYSKDKSQFTPSRTMNNIQTKNDNCTKSYKIDLTELIKRNPEKIIATPVVPAGVDSSCVQQCISTILDTFQGVRLTINNEGKVAAALNTPVTSLSTSELKVLASIIACAQTEVDALGVFSGTKTAETSLTATKTVQSLGVFPVTKRTETSTPVKEAVQAAGIFPGAKPPTTYFDATKYVQTSNIQTNVGTMAIISNNVPGETSNNKLIANNFSINLIPKPAKPMPLSSTSGATNELTLKLTPKPNKTLLEPFANYLIMKKQNFQESFLSYFENPEVNDSPTPVIQNVFSLQSTDQTASTSWHRQINYTTKRNELNMDEEKTSNLNQMIDNFSQTNTIKTYERKRKMFVELPESQKKIKSVPTELAPCNVNISTLQNLGAGTLNRNENIFTNISTTALPTSPGAIEGLSLLQQPNNLSITDRSDITINNISNALPVIIPQTYQPSQSGGILSVLLSDTSKQNKLMTQDSIITPPQSVRYVAPGPMLLVTPLMLATPPITVVPSNNSNIISESVSSAKNTIDTQITNANELNLLVKPETETVLVLSKELEVVESLEVVKEEECILGV